MRGEGLNYLSGPNLSNILAGELAAQAHGQTAGRLSLLDGGSARSSRLPASGQDSAVIAVPPAALMPFGVIWRATAVPPGPGYTAM